MTGAEEVKLAALRQEIGRARTVSVRVWLAVQCWTVVSALLVAVGMVGLIVALHHAGIRSRQPWILLLTGLTLVAITLGALLGEGALALDRRRHRRRLREKLARLDPNERELLLQPLMHAPQGSLRELGQALSRDAANPSELTPAAAQADPSGLARNLLSPSAASPEPRARGD